MIKIDWGMLIGYYLGEYMIFGWRYRFYPRRTKHHYSSSSNKLLYHPESTAWFRSKNVPCRWWPITNRRSSPPAWFYKIWYKDD